MGLLLEMIFHTPLSLMPLLAMFPSSYFIAVGNSVFAFAMMYHDLYISLTFMITTVSSRMSKELQTTNQPRACSQVAIAVFVDTC